MIGRWRISGTEQLLLSSWHQTPVTPRFSRVSHLSTPTFVAEASRANSTPESSTTAWRGSVARKSRKSRSAKQPGNFDGSRSMLFGSPPNPVLNIAPLASAVTTTGLQTSVFAKASTVHQRGDMSETTAARTSNTVILSFRLHYRCKAGQHLALVGAGPQLGEWDASKRVPLTWTHGDIWMMSIAVDRRTTPTLLYKFVICNSRGTVYKWQPGPIRKLPLPFSDARSREHAASYGGAARASGGLQEDLAALHELPMLTLDIKESWQDRSGSKRSVSVSVTTLPPVSSALATSKPLTLAPPRSSASSTSSLSSVDAEQAAAAAAIMSVHAAAAAAAAAILSVIEAPLMALSESPFIPSSSGSAKPSEGESAGGEARAGEQPEGFIDGVLEELQQMQAEVCAMEKQLEARRRSHEVQPSQQQQQHQHPDIPASAAAASSTTGAQAAASPAAAMQQHSIAHDEAAKPSASAATSGDAAPKAASQQAAASTSLPQAPNSVSETASVREKAQFFDFWANGQQPEPQTRESQQQQQQEQQEQQEQQAQTEARLQKEEQIKQAQLLQLAQVASAEASSSNGASSTPAQVNRDVAITFRLHYRCSFGQHLSIVGAGQHFGDWDLSKRVHMAWTDNDFWEASITVDSRSYQHLDYKYVVCESNGIASVWQPGDTSVLELPDHAAALDVMDSWGDSAGHGRQLSMRPGGADAAEPQAFFGFDVSPDAPPECDPVPPPPPSPSGVPEAPLALDLASNIVDLAREPLLELLGETPTEEAVEILVQQAKVADDELATAMMLHEQALKEKKDPFDPEVLRADRVLAAAYNNTLLFKKMLAAATAQQAALPEGVEARHIALPEGATSMSTF